MKIKYHDAVHKRRREAQRRFVKNHPGYGALVNKNWVRNHPERAMFSKIRARAKAEGVEFNIDIADIVIPTFCPLLGVRLTKKGEPGRRTGPSLDRKNPKKGYVKGNVWVISMRANTIKNDATLAELTRMVRILTKGSH